MARQGTKHLADVFVDVDWTQTSLWEGSEAQVRSLHQQQQQRELGYLLGQRERENSCCNLLKHPKSEYQPMALSMSTE